MSPLRGRRKRTVVATIVSDPYRKLAAIALAIGLWYFLNSQISRPIDVSMRLTYGQPGIRQLAIVLGDDEVVGTRLYDNEDKTIDHVKLTLHGRNTEVARVEAGLTLTVSFENIKDWSTRGYVEFDASDLGPPSQLRGLTVVMEPAVVRIDVNLLIYLPIVISLDHVDLQVDDKEVLDRLRLDTAKFEPTTARVLGPANRIDAFRSLMRSGTQPFKASIEGKPTGREVSRTLSLTAPPDWNLAFELDPSMTIRINPLTEEFRLDVPVIVDDLALQQGWRGQYVVDGANHLLVPINAGGELRQRLVELKAEGNPELNDWAWNHLRLNVWIGALDAAITPPPTLTRVAELRLVGPLSSRVDSSDYSLAELVPITLKKR